MLSIAAQSVLALLSTSIAPTHPPEIRPAETRIVRFTTGDGRNAAARVDWRSDFDGTLYVHAAHPDASLELTLLDDEGTILARDARHGIIATRHARAEVTPGAELRIALAADEPDALATEVEIALIAVVESDTTRHAAQRAAHELAAIAELPAPKSTAARLEACIDALLAVDPRGESTRIAWKLWEAAIALEGQGPAEVQVRAFEPALAHDERVYPDDWAELQTTRFRTAYAMARCGRLVEAEALFERAVSGWTRGGAGESLDLQRARAAWAGLVSEHGEHERALGLYAEALEVLARTRPEHDIDRLGVEMNAGTALLALRQFDAACAALRRVVTVCARALPDEDPFRLRAEMNLGVALQESGDAAAGGECFARVAAVRERTLPADDPRLLRAQINLAIALKDSGRLERALEIEAAVLETLSHTVADDDASLQLARRNLANSLERSGRYDEAAELLDSVLATYERTRAPDDLEVADVRLSRASLAKKLGALEEAEAIEREFTASSLESFPAGHPRRLTARRNLAWTRALRRDRDELERDVEALLAETDAALEEAVRTASIREAEERALALRPVVSTLLSLCAGAGLVEPLIGHEPRLLALVEGVRSAGLRVAAARGPVGSDLRTMTVALAELVARGAPGAEIAAAQRAREALERAIADGARTELALDLPALDSDEAALVFTSYLRHDADARQAGGLAATEHMCAFVATARGVARVELGPAQRIVDHVERWRAAIGVGGAAAPSRGTAASTAAADTGTEDALGRALAECVLGPLAPALQPFARLSIVPDDALCLVPFDALPYERGRIGDRWSIHVRPTLARVPHATMEAPPRLLAVGAVDYDSPPDGAKGLLAAASPTLAPTRDALRGGGLAERFESLPASGMEARAIATLFTKHFGTAATSEVLDGSRASKLRLAALAPECTHLHIATHAYVLAAAGARGADAADERMRTLTPLLACGFALSGANVAQDAVGRLTALASGEDLASFDLSRCDLAVLSACETGLGIRRAGQGVASLQKALHMAGARSVITSLWRVPDEATAGLMLDFYRRLWLEMKEKHQALWEAKAKLREATDEHGAPKYSTRDWAAWVLTGDPN